MSPSPRHVRLTDGWSLQVFADIDPREDLVVIRLELIQFVWISLHPRPIEQGIVLPEFIDGSDPSGSGCNVYCHTLVNTEVPV